MTEKVICWKNEGWEDYLTVNKEYEGIVKHGFITNYIEIKNDKGFVTPIVTKYFIQVKWMTQKNIKKGKRV